MIPRDSTSIIRHVFIQDSTSTTGAGKTGLAYDTSGLTCYYIYPGGTATAITLEPISTLGTYQAPTSNAHMRFKEVSSTNMPGWYEIHLHNDWASLANARTKASLCLKGASGMAPVNLSIDLIGFEIQSTAPNTTAQTVSDKTGYALTSSERSSIATEVWSSATRTLTSFGTLVSDIWSAGTRTLTSFGSLASDVATAVWGAGTRTLTSFGTLVSDIWSNATRSLTSYLDSSGVTTLLGRVVGTIASGTHQPQSGDAYARIGANGSGLTSLGDTRLANLDATISSRLASSSYTAPDNANISAIKAKTDNLPSNPAAVGSQMDLVSSPNSSAVSAIASAVGYALKKGVSSLVPFAMTDSTSHIPVTGKTVSAQICKDGGTFASTTNSAVEIGNGVYAVTLTASEMNASSIVLRASATGCDDTLVTLFTQS